jgi:hypothetical protein
MATWGQCYGLGNNFDGKNSEQFGDLGLKCAAVYAEK